MANPIPDPPPVTIAILLFGCIIRLFFNVAKIKPSIRKELISNSKPIKFFFMNFYKKDFLLFF
jgi:hypothetical protein